jgi:hypothetical protein
VREKLLSCMLLLMVPEQDETGTVVHTAFMLFLFVVLCSLFLSFLLWNSLWLVEEVLTLLCLFLIVRMEIS